MPTYAYRCQRCGEEIEVFQSMSDPPLKRCRSCRGALRRVYHPVGIVLKGSGFYKTDNRASSSRPSKDSDTKSSDAKSSDAKSSDAKSSDTKSSDTKSSDTKSADKPKDK